ncbi:MAG TPA: hypothetical protein VFQ53_03500 [Kofleriaceae bacterium]|nr:hypothetical protein [Kofleriaceae bacterium]
MFRTVTVAGVSLRVLPGNPVTTIEAVDPIDDRFTLAIVPRARTGSFDERFALHATPLDLPRVVLAPALREQLCALRHAPTIHVVDGALTAEVAQLEPAVLDVIAALVHGLAERSAICRGSGYT